MAKISDTFGYGEKVKKESPPMKKPLTTEPKPKKKIQTGSKSKETTTTNNTSTESKQQKPKPAKSGVKKWDFSSNPAASSLKSVTKSQIGGSGLGVDPELDGMLAQLEMDEDFMKLSDNDQITWLESLFFLDTNPNKATGGLVKPKPRAPAASNSRRPTSMPSKNVDSSSSSSPSVTAKSLSIQSNNKRIPPSVPALTAKKSESPAPGKNLAKKGGKINYDAFLINRINQYD